MYASIFFTSVSLHGGGTGRGHGAGRAGRGDVRLGGAVAGEELLRVAPHAVLVDVETLELLARRDAEADGLLACQEHAAAGDEHERGDDDDAERLDAALVRA